VAFGSAIKMSPNIAQESSYTTCCWVS